MSSIDVPLKDGGFGSTRRTDNWWVEPLLVFLGYMAFIVYATWAALQGNNYLCTTQCGGADYLSPMYSPLLFTSAPAWWPAFLPFSAAMLILWSPGWFRFTCYYYRGAYYKAFWADPISCAVGEPRKTYLGREEVSADSSKRPSLLSVLRDHLHLHPFCMTAIRALWFTGPDGTKHFGIGVGSLVLILNPILLGCTPSDAIRSGTWSAGARTCCRDSPVRKKAYDCVCCLNRSHMLWAWISMFYVGFADLYIRLCAMGIWTDWRIL